ncbi:MAG: hypothetical protein ACKVU1_04030 [bacterium]
MSAREHHFDVAAFVARCALVGVAFMLAPSASADVGAPAGPSPRSARHTSASEIDNSTWVDHDGHPIPQPPEWEPSFWGHQFREGVVEPFTHAFDIPDKMLDIVHLLGADTRRGAVNTNAFDEAPNSTWFTNRNHVRSVPVAELRRGAHPAALPAKPWTIKHAKQGGRTMGFQIKDADGAKWLVKLDPLGYPRLISGADRIAGTLLHAAGYNIPHNELVRFHRADLTIDADLLSGAEGELFTEADLDSLLARSAILGDGSYAAMASLFLSGRVLGAPSMRRLRPGDSNDWYAHKNRRELRGLFVLCSWLNSWDTKDHNCLDTFVETGDSLGHVEHYFLDVGASLGAGGKGPKALWDGYETSVDFGWIARRFVTLGFVDEPWRRAQQETGIPSVGNFESEVYEPEDFRTYILHPAFREMTDQDGYWGAKIVASFSDAQIAAVVDGVEYEDPRANEFLVRALIERRDKVARHWFGRIAPLDFFHVRDGALHFHDLAVDVGLDGARAYDIDVRSSGGSRAERQRIQLNRTELPLSDFGGTAQRLSLKISVAGSSAKASYVELTRKDSGWVVTRVRHG